MATQKMPPMKGGVPKHVKAADDGQVDQPTVDLSKSAGDEVVWSSVKPAKIAFEGVEGSPFDETTFRIPPGGSVSSGPARDDADLREYKYTVYGAGGKNDPTVIIHK
jgi:hypothetical protein